MTTITTLENTEIEKLVDLIKLLNNRGHNFATSGNYSLYDPSFGDYALVSESGIDKANFHRHHFLPVHLLNRSVDPDPQYQGRKSSDETAIHLTVYNNNSDARCVLHSHFLESILFANLKRNQEMIEMTGLELLKAFPGVKSHEEKIYIPIFDNTQDIETLAHKVAPLIKKNPQIFSILLRGHGIYVWGKSVLEAKKHLEALEYIFKYFIEMNKIPLS